MVDIRPAAEADAPTIKKMVKDEQLDPTSLDWQHFLIAELDGKTVGIGQIKEYPGARELGSLVVLSEYRNQGIASALIHALEARSEYPLYLFCLQENETFYNRFGYQKIRYGQAPM